MPGFAWPVPMAFAAAISGCRFEQGDVLYSARNAYRGWPAGRRGVQHCIQVLDPPRSARASLADGQGMRFLGNWEAAVELDLFHLGDNTETGGRPSSDRVRSERLRTTQGRLFHCLWRALPATLRPQSAAPEPPALLRALQGRLAESAPAVSRLFGLERQRALDRRVFVFAVDLASDASRVKAHAIESALCEHFEVEAKDLAPARAGLTKGECFHPALRLCALALTGTRDVESVLKPILYTPVSADTYTPVSADTDTDTDTDAEAKPAADRFKLARHGLLLDASGEPI